MAGVLLLGQYIEPVTGNSLINESGSGYSYIFANLMKTVASNLVPNATASYAFQPHLDSNGYPNNAPGGTPTDNIRYQFGFPPEWGTETIIVKFSGTGGFYMQPAAISNFTVLSGTVTLNSNSLPTFVKITGVDLRISFNFTSAPLTAIDAYTGYFMSDAVYSDFSNLIVCRASDEAALDANPNALNPDYVAMVRTLNPKIYRTLDLSGTNGANQSQFSQRAPSGAFSFNVDRWPPECWGGVTTGVGSGASPYIISAPSTWAGLVDGATVQLQFGSANTTTQPVINVGGTGNVRITTLGPADLGIGALAANAVWTLTYSSVYNYWTGRLGGIISETPIEQQVAIANAVNAHLWATLSHRYSPADSAAVAAVVKANLNPGLSFYVEMSNEVWNTTFTQTSYISNLGLTMGFTSSDNRDLHAAYGLLVRRMMGAITTEWGGPDSRLRRVMAVQAFGNSLIGGANVLYRLNGRELAPSGTGAGGLGAGNALYNSFSGSADYTTAPGRPIDFCDVLSYATYYSGGELQQFEANYTPTAATLLGNPSTLPTKTITGVTQANPGVLTYGSDPGYSTGDRLNIQGVGGMTQLRQQNVTVIRLTATTYSMYTDAAMTTTLDTSGYSAFTSGGTSGKYDTVAGLMAWADQYALGTAPDIAAAFADLDNDLRAGQQYNSSTGVLGLGNQTLSYFNSNIYPAWEAIAALYDGARPAGTTNLTVDCYEGAMAGTPLTAANCTALGISTTYATTTQDLMFAYKNDALFQTLVADQFAQFMAQTHSATPGWYQIVGLGGPWAMTPGNLYTLPPEGSTQYKSWDATVAYNS
jgi:hypothetical protein